MSALTDLLAYGRHLEHCSKCKVLARPNRKYAAPVFNAKCSCGYDAALDRAAVLTLRDKVDWDGVQK